MTRRKTEERRLYRGDHRGGKRVSRFKSLVILALGFAVPVAVQGPAPALAATFAQNRAAGIPGSSGARDGSAEGPMLVVGLGDSIESGYHCDCTNYVSSAAWGLGARKGREVVVDNQAVAGITTADVLEQLRSPVVRSRVAASDLVIVEIGANDFVSAAGKLQQDRCLPVETKGCYVDEMARMRRNLTAIVEQVKALQRGTAAQVIVLGYWNVFRDGAVARPFGPTYGASADQLTRWANREMEQVARSAQVPFGDAYTPFKGGGTLDPTYLLADDGEHPNAAGHALLTDVVLSSLGMRELTSSSPGGEPTSPLQTRPARSLPSSPFASPRPATPRPSPSPSPGTVTRSPAPRT